MIFILLAALGITPVEAVPIALSDAAANQTGDAIFWRYISLASPSDGPTVDLILNDGANRSPVPIISSRSGRGTTRIGDGSVVRIDLRQFNQLENLTSEWERLAEDEPYYLADTTASIKLKGKTIEVRAMGPHVPDGVTLQQMCGSAVPIVRGEWLSHKLLTATAGGRYYEFLGIRKANSEERSKGQTDFRVWLARNGAFLSTSFRLEGVQKWATYRSNVTGAPREVTIVRSLRSRPTENDGLIVFTRDPSVDDVTDDNSNPVLRLTSRKFSAIEAFAQQPWGGIETTIFNGDEELIRFAEPTIVTDRTVPAPHPARLEPKMSCKRCHGAVKGWHPLPYENSIQRLIDSRIDLYPLTPEQVNVAAGQFTGNFDRLLSRARDDLSATYTRITGTPDPDVVSIWSAKVSEYHDDYFYSLVGPQKAAGELGVELSEEAASSFFGQMLLQFVGLSDIRTRIASLSQGIHINRNGWEKIYVAAASAMVNMPSYHPGGEFNLPGRQAVQPNVPAKASVRRAEGD